MDTIVAARYAPLVLAQPVNPLPPRDYLKYMPKFTGKEDTTAEEHLAFFYSYADNLNIVNEDVWMRVFIQSLDGEVRKWFRGVGYMLYSLHVCVCGCIRYDNCYIFVDL
jgi:hypothetical protein